MQKRVKTEQPPASDLPQPHDRVVRVREVVKITGFSVSTIYVYRKAGLFPKGFIMGKKSRAWLLSDVMNWLESRKAGAK